MNKQNTYMRIICDHARTLAQNGEVPVAAVIVPSDVETHDLTKWPIFGNAMRETCDPTAHAEICALRETAKRLALPRLDGFDLYVTLEPCTMCAAAIALARIRRVYFGAYDTKFGAIDHGVQFFQQPTCHHSPECYGGICERECADILQDFFQARR
ncbi:MAG: nucleoside deaminase [Pseudomonadota bacterium]